MLGTNLLGHLFAIKLADRVVTLGVARRILGPHAFPFAIDPDRTNQNKMLNASLASGISNTFHRPHIDLLESFTIIAAFAELVSESRNMQNLITAREQIRG